MAVTYGFFNSVNGDRKYNADQMSEFYTGIANDGVFQHIDNGLAVSAGTGLTVNVATGRALIRKKWVNNDAVLTKTISAASATYARIDAVVIRFSKSNRNVSIVVKDGTPAASPSAPSMTRNSDVYEMALAYVNVAANATSVTVTDKRSDTTVCGWVSVAQQTSGEVDAMLNAMKTGFDGVVYPSPAAMVQGEDEVLQGKIDTVGEEIGVIEADFIGGYYTTGAEGSTATYTAFDGMVCAIHPCTCNDVITVTLSGASSARAFAYLDRDYKVLSRSPSNIVYDDQIISTPPDNCAYVVFNNRTKPSESNPYRATGYYARIGKYPVDSIKSSMLCLGGTKILSGSDLNEITTPGTYFIASASDAAQISNVPYDGSGARVIVIATSSTGHMFTQLYMVNTQNTVIYMRHYDDVSFTAWTRICSDNRNLAYQTELSNSDDMDTLIFPGMYYVVNDGTGTWKPDNYPLTRGSTIVIFGKGTSESTNHKAQFIISSDEILFRLGLGNGNWGEWVNITEPADIQTKITEQSKGKNDIIASLAERILSLEQADGKNVVPDYYETHITGKIESINELRPVSGDQFAFITDTHIIGYHNAMNSHALLNRICKESMVSKVFNGGDILHPTNKTDIIDYIDCLRDGVIYTQTDTQAKSYYVGGNHDLGANNPSAIAKLSSDQLARLSNLFAPDECDIVYDNNFPFQYYFDNNGIRYIVLCMGMNGGSGISGHTWWDDYGVPFDDCLPFYIDALKTTPSGYHVVVIQHMSGITTSSNTATFADITSSNYINYLYKPFVAYQQRTTYTNGSFSADFSDASGIAACMIFGHAHRDITGISSDISISEESIGGSIPLFVTTTDNAGGNLDEGVTRELGTYTEQAFDVFTVDKTNRKIYVTRIGGGNDRTNGGAGYSY